MSVVACCTSILSDLQPLLQVAHHKPGSVQSIQTDMFVCLGVFKASWECHGSAYQTLRPILPWMVKARSSKTKCRNSGSKGKDTTSLLYSMENDEKWMNERKERSSENHSFPIPSAIEIGLFRSARKTWLSHRQKMLRWACLEPSLLTLIMLQTRGLAAVSQTGHQCSESSWLGRRWAGRHLLQSVEQVWTSVPNTINTYQTSNFMAFHQHMSAKHLGARLYRWQRPRHIDLDGAWQNILEWFWTRHVMKRRTPHSTTTGLPQFSSGGPRHIESRD